ncbi:hypothetical protein [Candidatus Chrysopegis kryptomonas]|jgi:hypothetical protein|uniref:Uncharacterized protein n=1 Tax=Candidatus Chryseopegocella kryptomonas TaxID=1633643 RepID=A0A0N7MW06_9BACT|nr:hypothetical protein [Candidatus Chrysopegis kryptomonas]CUS97307.1 hypothetical protein JGI23_00279 [Candidatus Chrysopegis kryptomonas]
MRRLILALTFAVGLISLSFSQFKEQVENKPDIYQSIIQGGQRSYLGFFNPANLFMRHTFSVSYLSIGGKGMMINSYTNSILYRFSDNLNLQADISLVHSPFNSFGNSFQKGINGIYINRIELNYRPLENMFINIQYRQVPFYYYPYYYRW